jgi:uncharacterized protein
MTVNEQALIFDCEGDSLVGILNRTTTPATRGVLIAVGGPQYRVGSHRQFTLLARHLAERGIPVLRFDYRGMGDSTGRLRTFEGVSQDIRCAIDRFIDVVGGLEDVVIWGLCDAASAALFYAPQDARVSGLVLVNPWVRTAEGEAKAYLRHYYLPRLLSAAAWHKLLRGEFELKRSVRSLARNFRQAIGSSAVAEPGDSIIQPSPELVVAKSLPERMADGLARFNGRVLLILSGKDLTAKEFIAVSEASKTWRRLLASPRVTRHVLVDATHTFSRREWRDQAAAWTAAWLQSW